MVPLLRRRAVHLETGGRVCTALSVAQRIQIVAGSVGSVAPNWSLMQEESKKPLILFLVGKRWHLSSEGFSLRLSGLSLVDWGLPYSLAPCGFRW